MINGLNLRMMKNIKNILKYKNIKISEILKIKNYFKLYFTIKSLEALL